MTVPQETRVLGADVHKCTLLNLCIHFVPRYKTIAVCYAEVPL